MRLAGNPESVLDIPCGTGRFWSMLAESPTREIYACDLSMPMIRAALAYRPPEITDRIHAVEGSAFDIPRDNKFVENIFCMRLLHHIGKTDERMALLSEFRRVATETVCVSLWVDGNYKSRRRRRSNKAAEAASRSWNRYVVSRGAIEQEFHDAGFAIVDYLDFLSFYSMLRIYVLKVEPHSVRL